MTSTPRSQPSWAIQDSEKARLHSPRSCGRAAAPTASAPTAAPAQPKRPCRPWTLISPPSRATSLPRRAALVPRPRKLRSSSRRSCGSQTSGVTLSSTGCGRCGPSAGATELSSAQACTACCETPPCCPCAPTRYATRGCRLSVRRWPCTRCTSPTGRCGSAKSSSACMTSRTRRASSSGGTSTPTCKRPMARPSVSSPPSFV
mmetsp:Transcript_3395/g.11400  ORF Transcript_3395/g.11400 Transcript_3395/m.11400 type:complete len:203 (+) Transcript_3395:1518-2126(+)